MKTHLFSPLLLAMAMSACTTTSSKLYEHPAITELQSHKSALLVANCIADHMTGANLRTDGPDHFWIVRENSFGVIGRWDVYRTLTGSRAEWRRVSDLTTGGGAGRDCV
jgi:hypothetical protein